MISVDKRCDRLQYPVWVWHDSKDYLVRFLPVSNTLPDRVGCFVVANVEVHTVLGPVPGFDGDNNGFIGELSYTRGELLWFTASVCVYVGEQYASFNAIRTSWNAERNGRFCKLLGIPEQKLFIKATSVIPTSDAVYPGLELEVP